MHEFLVELADLGVNYILPSLIGGLIIFLQTKHINISKQILQNVVNNIPDTVQK